MQLGRALSVAWVLLWAGPAAAACDFGVYAGALLNHNSGAAAVLSSENGGSPAVLVVTNLSNLFGTTITVSAPQLLSYPAGFSAGSATVEHIYSASWLLGSSSNGTYTTQARSFAVPVAAVVTLTLNHRVTASGGFRQGEYKTRTSISCS